MQILFLRHGEADWPEWDKPDDERPLTKNGRKEMKRVAEFLAQLKFCPEAIFSSPLPRATQTAEIAAKRFDRKVKIEPRLVHGFSLEKLRGIVGEVKADECVMIVGHEPEFSQVIEKLTGGRVKLSKAGVALVEVDHDCKSGELRWLFPPKIAKAPKL
jgi:phosphohistidine phosphatase